VTGSPTKPTGGPTGDGAPCCGARLRTGGRCALSPAAGKRRCFQHGGARGSGAAKGNRNSWRDGFYTCEAKADQWVHPGVPEDVAGD